MRKEFTFSHCNVNEVQEMHGNLYQTINYASQEETMKKLNDLEKKIDLILSVMAINRNTPPITPPMREFIKLKC